MGLDARRTIGNPSINDMNIKQTDQIDKRWPEHKHANYSNTYAMVCIFSGYYPHSDAAKLFFDI